MDESYNSWALKIIENLSNNNFITVENNTIFQFERNIAKKVNVSHFPNQNKNSKNKINSQPVIATSSNNNNDDSEEDNLEEEEEDFINAKYIDSDDDNDNDINFIQNTNEHEVDVEDLGKAMKASTIESEINTNVIREMVTKLQRKSLTKEGYKIIGSHSAVKLCRWTKNQLRGRGGCYKHTFYGITSYQCMEATPSLACANKCVFCWRHHKNPVGKEWRWKTDDPEYIVSEAIFIRSTIK